MKIFLLFFLPLKNGPLFPSSENRRLLYITFRESSKPQYTYRIKYTITYTSFKISMTLFYYVQCISSISMV